MGIMHQGGKVDRSSACRVDISKVICEARHSFLLEQTWRWISGSCSASHAGINTPEFY